MQINTLKYTLYTLFSQTINKSSETLICLSGLVQQHTLSLDTQI